MIYLDMIKEIIKFLNSLIRKESKPEKDSGSKGGSW